MSDEIKNRNSGSYRRGGGNGRRQFRQGGQRSSNPGNRSYNKRPYNHSHHHHSSDDRKRAKFEVSKRLKEVDIGVTEFVGCHQHFSGIVKERYGDFHVHEISLDGEICKLTTQDFPIVAEENYDLNSLKQIIPPEALEKIELVTLKDSDVKEVEIDVTNLDKNVRKCIHTIAKKSPSMISETIEKGTQKFIVIKQSDHKSSSGNRFHKDMRVDWSNRPGQYCQFLIHKVNIDTMDMLNQLGSILRVKPNLFCYAGTKDRRARTTQWVCLKKIDPREILEATKRIRGVYAGNFKYVTDPLKLGMLKGNHFKIALRNITASDNVINTAMMNLREKGFINYYGLQRFGTVAEIPTHEIGKTMLQGKWHEVINLILQPRSGEDKDMTETRRIYAETKDAKAALKCIRKSNRVEVKLLEGILKSGQNNPQGALDALPRNIRTMYIHAYQSFVWNNIVSRRMREFGEKPIVGDLVYEKFDDSHETETLDYTIDLENEQSQDKKILTHDNNEPEKQTGNGESNVEEVENIKKIAIDESPEVHINSDIAIDTPLEKNDSQLPTVKVLTEEDLPNYTFADIVMPQPGWRVTYPTYAKSWFEEFLEKDGLTTDLRQRNKKYTLGGAYRKILQVPKDLTWRIIHYNEIRDDLILGDMEELRGQAPPEDVAEGKYKALIIEMSLKSSAYATMALREVLTHDTSSQTQAEQSAAHHAKDAEESQVKDESADNEKQINENNINTVCTTKTQDAEIKDSCKDENIDKDEVHDSKIVAASRETCLKDIQITEDKMNFIQTDTSTETAVYATDK